MFPAAEPIPPSVAVMKNKITLFYMTTDYDGLNLWQVKIRYFMLLLETCIWKAYVHDGCRIKCTFFLLQDAKPFNAAPSCCHSNLLKGKKVNKIKK